MGTQSEESLAHAGNEMRESTVATTVQDVMSSDLTMCAPFTTIGHAAELMRDADIGDVLVVTEGELMGIITDRDLVVRALAAGDDRDATIERSYSTDPVTVTPDTTIDAVISLMRERALRRVPVVEGRRPVGIISLGDLAIAEEPDSVLGRISSAPADS